MSVMFLELWERHLPAVSYSITHTFVYLVLRSPPLAKFETISSYPLSQLSGMNSQKISTSSTIPLIHLSISVLPCFPLSCTAFHSRLAFTSYCIVVLLLHLSVTCITNVFRCNILLSHRFGDKKTTNQPDFCRLSLIEHQWVSRYPWCGFCVALRILETLRRSHQFTHPDYIALHYIIDIVSMAVINCSVFQCSCFLPASCVFQKWTSNCCSR